MAMHYADVFFFFFFFFFVWSSGGVRSAGSDGAVGGLIECLAAAGVDNYTVHPVDPSDDAAASSYYRLLNFSIQNLRFSPRPGLVLPAAVLLPGSLPHLRGAVLCCRAAGFGVRIRSGGHSYEGLSYTAKRSAAPFVVVDLMRLNSVRVDPASRTAWVEAGATLGETYHAIAAAAGVSLAFSAGSCPTVGSGGHIAGGGFGLLSRKFGLAADNVLDAIMIAADGRVMDREAMGEDVFWAIRGGGGGGWGAIYAWQIRLLPVPPRVAAFVVNRPGTTSRVAELVHKWQFVAPGLPDEFYLSAVVGAGLPESTRAGMSVTFKGLYLGPKEEAMAIATRVFPELQLAEAEWQEMSWIESAVFFSGLPEGSTVSDLTNRILGDRKSFKAKSDYVRVPISESDLSRALEQLSAEPKAYVIMDPYGGAMARVSSDHLPFPHRSGNLYSIQYLIEWRREEEDDGGREEQHVAWLRAFYERMAGSVSEGPRAAYVNYLDLDLGVNGGRWTAVEEGGRDRTASARAWGERYFLGNFDRLVRAKTAVDPDDVFSNAQTIPPDPTAALRATA